MHEQVPDQSEKQAATSEFYPEKGGSAFQSPPAFSLDSSPVQRAVIQRTGDNDNYMDLNPGERGPTVTDGGIRRIQQRLIELNYLEGGTFAWGEMDEPTRIAMRYFSEEAQGAELLSEATWGARHMREDFDGRSNRQAQAGTDYSLDHVDDNDAMHQALSNAFPRRIFGRMAQNEEEAFGRIAARVNSRGLPFDNNAVNIVGVRGYQGGNAHSNSGARTSHNQYNDCFFVLTLNGSGEQVVREFRGTVDPGGRRSFTNSEDPRTHQMAADQQLPYRFRHRESPKFGRPMLGQVMGDAENPQVIDPHRAQMLQEGTEFYDPDESTNTHHPLDRSGRDDAYTSLRTVHGSRGDSLKTMGIAIHSGGGWDHNRITADSTGCQVVHGDWFGNFIETVRRGLTWGRIRSGDLVPENVEELDTEGYVTYSLLDARDFMEVDSD